MKSSAGATRWRAGRSGSGRRARRSPRVMVLLLMVVLMVVQQHGYRWFPLVAVALGRLLRRWWRTPTVVIPRTLVGHGGLPLFGHQAPGHGQPSSEILWTGDGAASLSRALSDRGVTNINVMICRRYSVGRSQRFSRCIQILYTLRG